MQVDEEAVWRFVYVRVAFKRGFSIAVCHKGCWWALGRKLHESLVIRPPILSVGIPNVTLTAGRAD